MQDNVDLSAFGVPVPVMGGYDLIPQNTILYLRADGNYTELHHITEKDDKKVMTKTLSSKGLKFFEEKLSMYSFMRIHDSYIVNLTKIIKYTREGKEGRVVLYNGKSLVVSRTRKNQLLAAFGLKPEE
ncbi:MAG: LytTR family transcriptional regulator [Prevotellaceae bacterium]|jgi:two-component system LytT family response regulator|nr:LytTR family transcriptional regulator [Prevotellaceae bacterium]